MWNGCIFILLLVYTHAFHLKSSRMAYTASFKSSTPSSLSMMQLDYMSTLQLALQATSKTTVAGSNDPTAGMTPEQITDYMSNVGGGMCGLPEPVGSLVGLGLNLSLLVFGVFTVSYVILGGLQFKYSKDVEELIENFFSASGMTLQPPAAAPGDFVPNLEGAYVGSGNASPGSAQTPAEKAANILDKPNQGLSREERRLRKKFKGKKNDKRTNP
jgi:hypothetical protein